MVGLPNTTPGDMQDRLDQEHKEFLVAELDIPVWINFFLTKAPVKPSILAAYLQGLIGATIWDKGFVVEVIFRLF